MHIDMCSSGPSILVLIVCRVVLVAAIVPALLAYTGTIKGSLLQQYVYQLSKKAKKQNISPRRKVSVPEKKIAALTQ